MVHAVIVRVAVLYVIVTGPASPSGTADAADAADAAAATPTAPSGAADESNVQTNVAVTLIWLRADGAKGRGRGAIVLGALRRQSTRTGD